MAATEEHKNKANDFQSAWHGETGRGLSLNVIRQSKEEEGEEEEKTRFP